MAWGMGLVFKAIRYSLLAIRYGLWAMGKSKEETPRITGGFPTIGAANSE
jgi:hypothetical protein